MDAATRKRRRFGQIRRRLVLGSLVLAMVMAANAVGAAASAGSSAAITPEQDFQVAPGDQSAIVVTGSGEASAPAEVATLQFVLSKDGAFPGGKSGGEGETEEGTPAPQGPPVVTEEDIAPIVEALVAAGVAEADIEVLISPFYAVYYGPGGAEVRVRFPSPEVERLSEIVTVGVDAVAAAGLTVQFVGAGYSVADCAPLVRQAREAAIADARAQAEELAELLGVTIGDVVLATELAYYGPAGEAPGCGEESFGEGIGSGPGFPLFDPTRPAEVEIYSQLTVGYAIA